MHSDSKGQGKPFLVHATKAHGGDGVRGQLHVTVVLNRRRSSRSN